MTWPEALVWVALAITGPPSAAAVILAVIFFKSIEDDGSR